MKRREPVVEVEMPFTKGYQTPVSEGILLPTVIEGETHRGSCLVQVYDEHDPEMTAPRAFFLVTDTGRGPDITTARAEIMSELYIVFGSIVNATPYDMVLIERIPGRLGRGDDAFNLVHVPWNGTMFEEHGADAVTLEEVEELIGTELK